MYPNFARFFIPALLILAVCFAPEIYAQKPPAQKVVSGIVLLNDQTSLDTKAMLNALKTTWKLRGDSVSVADKTLVFNTSGGVTVMVAQLGYPVALDEIGAAARLSTLWPTAAAETRNHSAQIVISVIGPANRTLDLYKIFTQTAAATLELTRSPGIYMSSQYLLLSNGFFSAAAKNMVQNQTLPLYCWVYFGMPGGSNAFTYGLQEFGLPEMEIVQSEHSESEVHALLYDAAMSVVKYGTHLQDGQSVSTEEGAKVPVKLTKATFVEGPPVLKLEY